MVAISSEAIYFCLERSDFTEFVELKSVAIFSPLIEYTPLGCELNESSFLVLRGGADVGYLLVPICSQANIVIRNPKIRAKITRDQCVEHTLRPHILDGFIDRFHEIAVFLKYDTKLVTR